MQVTDLKVLLLTKNIFNTNFTVKDDRILRITQQNRSHYESRLILIDPLS